MSHRRLQTDPSLSLEIAPDETSDSDTPKAHLPWIVKDSRSEKTKKGDKQHLTDFVVGFVLGSKDKTAN